MHKNTKNLPMHIFLILIGSIVLVLNIVHGNIVCSLFLAVALGLYTWVVVNRYE